MSKADNFKDKRNTKGFDQNPQNINTKGRPQKIYKIIKQKGYSADDIKTAFCELAWYNDKELAATIKKTTTPAIIKVIAGALQKAITAGNLFIVKDLIEHLLGKPKSSVEMSGDLGTREIDFTGWKPEEIKAFARTEQRIREQAENANK